LISFLVACNKTKQTD